MTGEASTLHGQGQGQGPSMGSEIVHIRIEDNIAVVNNNGPRYVTTRYVNVSLLLGTCLQASPSAVLRYILQYHTTMLLL